MTPFADEPIVLKWSGDENKPGHNPLVIHLGWAGCKDRYLAKYSKIYEDINLSIARFTVPLSKVRCYSSYRQFAVEIYEKILNLDEKELKFPIFFHLFSMNGCSLFSALWDLLDTTSNGNAIKRNVKGIIFDSCPANVMPWQSADAVSFASFSPSQSNSLSRHSYRYALTGAFSLHRAAVWLRSNFEPNIYEQHFSYFHLLKIPDLPKQQLYLYSSVDKICSASSIEYFQTAQLDRSCNLTVKRWDDSPHVEHLRHHAEVYTNLCVEFVKVQAKENGIINGA
uniref:Transmembrane protein 53 n=1 Tax=Ditylenchus dipsaci TaxID=166011 RepID=A0A915CYU4_9BILA